MQPSGFDENVGTFSADLVHGLDRTLVRERRIGDQTVETADARSNVLRLLRQVGALDPDVLKLLQQVEGIAAGDRLGRNPFLDSKPARRQIFDGEIDGRLRAFGAVHEMHLRPLSVSADYAAEILPVGSTDDYVRCDRRFTDRLDLCPEA